ncbi:zinc-dependent alcohol dehydrogenase [Deinococcus peraridilitoris]|uniref:Theronine dehydrogenase-like Zn-dependent dehydrogenase n=1 Tax=Deinococcus peraridilitoris (strain DSM 19664 / LMG 22246 / CIP 109416 / KR-200) TaxID=937777 RepID=L0A103_DEIPD|nr:galactitol-1-phosphate 5-dehydrogenase [Deinococcus peraridilitoris]AFZ67526.1 theronine dehydrogenase-like Zn-dependent dehydrogenase [Deinococcus peraridilitoris DSM 19664]
MKALVYDGPWQMPLRDHPSPVPQQGEVLVRVQAAGICGSDVHGFTGSTGRRTPGVVMGHEFCGVIEALGEETADRTPGERVVVQPIISCAQCAECLAGRANLCLQRRGIGWSVDGGYAELVRVPSRNALPLPSEISWHEGAMIEPLAVALHAVNLTPLDFGQTVVVLGAGPIGLLCVLALKLRGAGRVLVSDLSAHRLQLARQLGADLTLPADGDPVNEVRRLTGNHGADAVLEAVGLEVTAAQSLQMVRNGGAVTWVGNSAPTVRISMQEIVTREITVRGAYAFTAEFAAAMTLLRSGRLNLTPLIEHVAPLHEGPQLVRDLARGQLDAVKVVLEP